MSHSKEAGEGGGVLKSIVKSVVGGLEGGGGGVH